jgi:hypothetical protein
MKNNITYGVNNKTENGFQLSQTTINMLGVILFYVIVFVAVNVFSSQL